MYVYTCVYIHTYIYKATHRFSIARSPLPDYTQIQILTSDIQVRMPIDYTLNQILAVEFRIQMTLGHIWIRMPSSFEFKFQHDIRIQTSRMTSSFEFKFQHDIRIQNSRETASAFKYSPLRKHISPALYAHVFMLSRLIFHQFDQLLIHSHSHVMRRLAVVKC